MKSTIDIRVKIEGLSEFQQLPLTLPIGARLQDVFPALVQAYGDKVKPHLFNMQTGKLGVFMAIVNSEMVRLKDGCQRPLADGDEVFIISPLGGG